LASACTTRNEPSPQNPVSASPPQTKPAGSKIQLSTALKGKQIRAQLVGVYLGCQPSIETAINSVSKVAGVTEVRCDPTARVIDFLVPEPSGRAVAESAQRRGSIETSHDKRQESERNCELAPTSPRASCGNCRKTACRPG